MMAARVSGPFPCGLLTATPRRNRIRRPLIARFVYGMGLFSCLVALAGTLVRAQQVTETQTSVRGWPAS